MSCQYEKPYKPEYEVCPTLGFQNIRVGVPVEVKPFAKVGKVKAECVGKLEVQRGKKECEGHHKSTCNFTISQKMRVEVPVIFGAKTEVGEACIECNQCGERTEEAEPPRNVSGEEIFRGMINQQ